jgi:hypothetical protein
VVYKRELSQEKKIRKREEKIKNSKNYFSSKRIIKKKEQEAKTL